MKSKRLIAILIVFGFITLLVVLSSTVFTLQSISLNWLTTRSMLADETIDTFSNNIKFPLGESVFFLKKSKIVEDLEKEYPYLQVLNIETKFPNSAVIHVAERKQLYAIKLNNSNYIVLDKGLKILNYITDDELNDISEGSRPAIVRINKNDLTISQIEDNKIKIETTRSGVIIQEDFFGIGDFLKIEDVDTCLKSLTKSLLEAGYKDQSIRGFISEININSAINKTSLDIKTRCGIKIDIKDCMAEGELTPKLVCGVSAYEKLRMEPYFATAGTISVFKSLVDNKIYAVHSYD